MTVYHRFLWLSNLATVAHQEFLENIDSVQELYLDEMESIEHTKLKPLTLPLLVDQNQRILGISAGVIPAKGHLAEISTKKYGFRVSESSQLITKLLANLPINIAPTVVKTDGKTSYRALIESRLPGVQQEVYIRKAEKDKEQPFLNHHKRKFDPMFAINQRCAKLRADVNRLIRRSWCTTKKIENLQKHLTLYACYNNEVQFI